jgi:hypothetical protein
MILLKYSTISVMCTYTTFMFRLIVSSHIMSQYAVHISRVMSRTTHKSLLGIPRIHNLYLHVMYSLNTLHIRYSCIRLHLCYSSNTGHVIHDPNYTIMHHFFLEYLVHIVSIPRIHNLYLHVMYYVTHLIFMYLFIPRILDT